MSPRPARLHRFWEGLPPQVNVVQAAYTRHRDGRILLFSGEWGVPLGRARGAWAQLLSGLPPAGPQFWVFRDRQLEGGARPLAELGLPAGEEVDAAFSWPLNGKTYLVRGHRYWRYDEAAARPDPGYPRDLSLWEGAPPSPDDVAVSNDGRRARAPAGQLLALGLGLEVVLGVGGAGAAGTSPAAPRPPCRCHLLLQGRPLLALSQGQRQGRSGLPAAHGPPVVGLPGPQRWPSLPQTPQSDSQA